MEKIKRKIKLFWTQNGKPLLQILGVILLIILAIQAANQYVIMQNKSEKTLEYQQQKKKSNNTKVDKNYIDKFIKYCNENNVNEAYKMLSKNCKMEKYPSVEIFRDKYISKIFQYKRDYKIDEEENNYKITFFEDALQSGKIENRGYIEDIYHIEEDVLEGKCININLYNNI